MLFEYDPAKSARNRLKHGIDFEEAKRLWEDPRFIEMDVAYEDEARYAVIGKIDGKHWTAIITYRGLVVRLISVRRSRKRRSRFMVKSIKAEEFDRIFDEGQEDIVDYLDLSTARRPNLDTDLRRVNVDFPEWMIDELDREAKRIGINRQAVIKTWIADCIDRKHGIVRTA